MDWLLQNIVGTVVSLTISGVCGWLVSRRKDLALPVLSALFIFFILETGLLEWKRFLAEPESLSYSASPDQIRRWIDVSDAGAESAIEQDKNSELNIRVRQLNGNSLHVIKEKKLDRTLLLTSSVSLTSDEQIWIKSATACVQVLLARHLRDRAAMKGISFTGVIFPFEKMTFSKRMAFGSGLDQYTLGENLNAMDDITILALDQIIEDHVAWAEFPLSKAQCQAEM